ncbi:hypothetical protein H0H92_010071, partial [Tricholoma furcatifolium]
QILLRQHAKSDFAKPEFRKAAPRPQGHAQKATPRRRVSASQMPKETKHWYYESDSHSDETAQTAIDPDAPRRTRGQKKIETPSNGK